ncbi:hypothetical protein [Streptomyces huiliensis]|uniref:hypothetical protein n=1 Tax=Streptomyces huiliensis TaxID=2876027 RepID=UPI001CBF4A5A|nr:hypothetical protein [Streptomyces huiliensis]MBZ4319292.1 hypothetical protein [Streptomyces huiliensis]
MPQRRRPSAAGLMLLLLLAVLGPALSGPAPAAAAALTGARTAVAPGAASSPVTPRPDAVVVTAHGDHDGDGGSCRPHDAPLKGTEAVVPHAPTDPLTASATARTPLPPAPAPRARAPRAPPATLVGSAELLPVLRI